MSYLTCSLAHADYALFLLILCYVFSVSQLDMLPVGPTCRFFSFWDRVFIKVKISMANQAFAFMCGIQYLQKLNTVPYPEYSN
jgi:hypothetical protein